MVCLQRNSVDHNNLKIVCYTGGACGDLISALIDPRDAEFQHTAVKHHVDRVKLKKHFLFANDQEKDLYIEQVGNKYSSISSHDLEYHIRQQHSFISIVTNDLNTATLAANRFKQLHRPQVWEELTKMLMINTVADYAQMIIDYSNMVKNYSDNLIKLEDIFNGHAIHQVENILGYQLEETNKNFYSTWLSLQTQA